jgi:hypothetical protein
MHLISFQVPEDLAAALVAHAEQLRIPYGEYIRVHAETFIAALEQATGRVDFDDADHGMITLHYTYPDRPTAAQVGAAFPDLEISFKEGREEWAGKGPDLE